MLNHRFQNLLLLTASYVFYGWFDWRFLSLLFLSTSVDYFCGLKMGLSNSRFDRKVLLWISLICNLGILSIFKYYDFFIESALELTSLFGFQINLRSFSVVLPLGISFYTFQSMSYSIDIYRKEMKPVKSFFDFALFVSFFPQLVAGPIERAKNLLPQITKQRELNPTVMEEGFFLILWGLFKKVAIADNAAFIACKYFDNYETAGAFGIMLGLYAFALQLYCDFSGYSDIARGLAKIMGFELMVNFNLPYIARNPSDFWARWHISLTSWVRDYLFRPLAIMCSSSLQRSAVTVLTMMAIGLWHGASWTFVLWGLYFGVIQVVYNMVLKFINKYRKPLPGWETRITSIVSRIVMFHIFVLSGTLFRAEDLSHTIGVLKVLASGVTISNGYFIDILLLLFLATPVILMQIAQYTKNDPVVFLKCKSVVKFELYTIAFFFVIALHLFGGGIKGGEEFLYFQF